MVQYILLSDCALLSVTQASSVRTSRHAPPPYLYLATSEMWCWSAGSGILTELSLCYSIVYHCNVAQWYEHFLQVGRLYRALILLGLALCFPSTSVSSVFVVLYIFKKIFVCYILYFTCYWVTPGGIGRWPGWLTIVLQCYDTVGLVVWPVKSSTKWPIKCRVGR